MTHDFYNLFISGARDKYFHSLTFPKMSSNSISTSSISSVSIVGLDGGASYSVLAPSSSRSSMVPPFTLFKIRYTRYEVPLVNS